jgi:hypothetical protein
MAGALAIASITATLKLVLGNGLLASSEATSVGDVSVTALPPDRIVTGSEERTQLNLFMYRVAPHTKLSTISKGTQGGKSQKKLTLDLYYLLTAYSAQEFQGDILLGCAMQLLSETPVLSRDMIGAAFESSLSNKSSALAKADSTGGIDTISLTPQFLSFEELSKLWSSFQARCRPSMSYEVSAVVINGLR